LCGIGLPKELIKKVLKDAGIDEMQRGEDLSLGDFAKLTDCMLRILSKT
jgi:16S rRNA A1518/A1519 N6-dimethyltransferase RsmA/KsgA/DIM1 with predicted DNA glycosylase/AP lyase activity